jgi:hypothetical protein
LVLNCTTSSTSVPLGLIYKCYNIVILNCITSSMSVALGLIYKCYILLLDCIASWTSVSLCLIQILYIVTEWYYYVHCKSQGNESTGKVVTKNGDSFEVDWILWNLQCSSTSVSLDRGLIQHILYEGQITLSMQQIVIFSSFLKFSVDLVELRLNSIIYKLKFLFIHWKAHIRSFTAFHEFLQAKGWKITLRGG